MHQNKEQNILYQFSKIKEQNTLYQNKEQNVLYQFSQIKSKILFIRIKSNALYQNKEQLLVVQDKEQNQDKEEPFGKHLLFKRGWTVLLELL